MKVLNPREYKELNPNAYLNDYLTYLEGIQSEAEETLKNAKNMALDEKIIASIQKQEEEIFEMAVMVEDYMEQIILKSIDTLSLEELQSYFNFEEEENNANKKSEELEDEKKEIQVRLEEVLKQINANLYSNGRVSKFYEVADVADFFNENEGPNEFIKNLLSNPITNELSKDIKIAIKNETVIQNIEIRDEDINLIVSNIMEFFNRCKNILNYSNDALEQLSKIILSGTGIKQILPESFDQNTALYLMYDLINLKRFNTQFYLNLPDALKESLKTERLHGAVYEILNKTYQAFLKGEKLPDYDLNEEEKMEQNDLEGQLDKIKADLGSLDSERNARLEFLNNPDAMRSVLRERISKMIDKVIPLEDIDVMINEEDAKLEKLRNDLSNASNMLTIKIKDIKRAYEILVDPEYHEFFQSVELNNVRRLYKAFGVNVTEEVITPFLIEEKRRLEQIEILTSLQTKLNKIYQDITSKQNKANFITRRLSSFKEELSRLKDEYRSTVESTFDTLKEKDLLVVNAPQISDESTVGNVIIIPEEKEVIITFCELNGLKQILWNMSIGIDENTKKSILANNTKYDNWDSYYNDLISEHAKLIEKLFTFKISEEGYYEFTLTEEESEQLKQYQKDIIAILSSVYEERKSFRDNLGDAPTTLDEDKVKELEYFLGKNANLSRENLANYLEETQVKIDELKEMLANNYSTCQSLGISLPDVVESDEEKKADNIIEERIKELNIDGVTTLEEARNYRDFLLCLEEYQVHPSKVKEYYLSHKMN